MDCEGTKEKELKEIWREEINISFFGFNFVPLSLCGEKKYL